MMTLKKEKSAEQIFRTLLRIYDFLFPTEKSKNTSFSRIPHHTTPENHLP